MKYLSLFTGIGGLDLGLDRAGMACIGQVEIDPYCRAVLARHWPDVRRMEDVRDVQADTFAPPHGPDLICGGFPCQDISVAGKGVGLSGARSGLWYEMLRVIRALRPRWVLAENVPALRSRGADEVLEGLERAGYTCWPVVVGADDVGAPHRRKRVFIVGRLADAEQCQGGAGCGPAMQWRWSAEAKQTGLGGGPDGAGPAGPERHGVADPAGGGLRADGTARAGDRHADERGAAGLVHADRAGLRTGRRPESDHVDEAGPRRWPARPGEPQHDWEAPRLADTGRVPRQEAPTGAPDRAEGTAAAGPGGSRVPGERRPQPRVGHATDGLPRRVAGFARRNALRALGNAVVPQVAEVIGRAIMAADGVTHQ